MPRTRNYNGPQCGALPRPNSVRTWPCKNAPMEGETRCRFHGGKTLNHGVKVAQARMKNEASKALRQLNITPVDDPLTELKNLAGEAIAWKQEMARLVGDLEQVRYRAENSEQTRAEITLFERAMDRCSTILGQIAKLNIDERLAAITEQQARMLNDALFAAFEAAGLTITDVEQKRVIAREFGRHLRLVA